MLKGGALYYAILVAFLVALLTGFLMMNIWFHHYHSMVLLQDQRLERNIRSALVLAREMPALVSAGESKPITLFDDEEEAVILSKKQWGGYHLVRADASWRNLFRSSIELCGSDIFKDEPVALYLADKERYLSVSGETLLNGNCYLPKLGIRRAYIEGMSFQGDELVHGKSKTSQPNLPEVEASLTDSNLPYLTGTSFPADSMLSILRLMKADTIDNSFYRKTVVFFSNEWITLSGKVLNGNVRIVSSKGITIQGSSKALDVILYAPRIEVGKGFTGSIQLFARDTVYVREGSRLLFPSMIAMLNMNCEKPLLEIEKNCQIKGDIVMTCDKAKRNLQAECKLNDGSETDGRVYCDGKIHLKGEIHGSLYCNGFILRTPSSLYENHLLNTIIDFKSLSPHYSGSLFFKITDRYKSIKWLN